MQTFLILHLKCKAGHEIETKLGQTRGRIAVVNLCLIKHLLGDFLGGKGGAIRGAHVVAHIGARSRAGAGTQGV